MAKTITAGQKMQAEALYGMAADYYVKAREFEAMASEIIGTNDADCQFNDFISDGIYGYDKPQPFEKVFKRTGVIVKTAKKLR